RPALPVLATRFCRTLAKEGSLLAWLSSADRFAPAPLAAALFLTSGTERALALPSRARTALPRFRPALAKLLRRKFSAAATRWPLAVKRPRSKRTSRFLKWLFPIRPALALPGPALGPSLTPGTRMRRSTLLAFPPRTLPVRAKFPLRKIPPASRSFRARTSLIRLPLRTLGPPSLHKPALTRRRPLSPLT